MCLKLCSKIWVKSPEVNDKNEIDPEHWFYYFYCWTQPKYELDCSCFNAQLICEANKQAKRVQMNVFSKKFLFKNQLIRRVGSRVSLILLKTR